MPAFLTSPGQFDIVLTMSGLDTSGCVRASDCETGSPTGDGFEIQLVDPVVLADYNDATPNETTANPLGSGSIRLRRGQWSDPLAYLTPYRYSPDAGDCQLTVGTPPFDVPAVPCMGEYSGSGIIDGTGLVGAQEADLSVCTNLWSYCSGWSIYDLGVGGPFDFSPSVYAELVNTSATDCSSGQAVTRQFRLCAFAWPLLYDLSGSPWDTNNYFACVSDDPATATPLHCSGWSVLIQLQDIIANTGAGGTVFYGQVETVDDFPPLGGTNVPWSYEADQQDGAPGFSSLTDYNRELRRTAAQLGQWGVGTVSIARAAPDCDGSEIQP